MVSVERIQNYTRLEQEAPAHTDQVMPSGWPREGDIFLRHVRLNYREASQPALDDINLAIASNEKVICKSYMKFAIIIE